MHETAKACRRGEPGYCVDMVRHHHEPDTTGLVLLQLLVEHSQHDPLRMVMVQEPTTSIDGERDEMGIQLVIDDLSRVFHAAILPKDREECNLLGLGPTGSENRCHPRNHTAHQSHRKSWLQKNKREIPKPLL